MVCVRALHNKLHNLHISRQIVHSEKDDCWVWVALSLQFVQPSFSSQWTVESEDFLQLLLVIVILNLCNAIYFSVGLK